MPVRSRRSSPADDQSATACGLVRAARRGPARGRAVGDGIGHDPTTIGFDDLAPATTVTSQYAQDGVRFGRASDFGQAPLGNSECGAPHVVAAATATSAPNVAQAPRGDTPGGFAAGTLAVIKVAPRSDGHVTRPPRLHA